MFYCCFVGLDFTYLVIQSILSFVFPRVCWQEKQLCREIRLPPTDYLKMQELMTIQIMSGYIAKKSDAYSFFNKVEPSKVDRVYDMLVKKGLAQA